MPPVTRVGDISTGHGSFPPNPNATGSSDTFANSIAITRVGDAMVPHGSPSPSPPHGAVSATGSPNTFVNGSPATRIGDVISCGEAHATGSSDVFIN